MYLQNDVGFVMVRSLSVLIFQLYIQNSKSTFILNHSIYKQCIIVYFRCVDDIFVLFKSTNRQSEIYLLRSLLRSKINIKSKIFFTNFYLNHYGRYLALGSCETVKYKKCSIFSIYVFV